MHVFPMSQGWFWCQLHIIMIIIIMCEKNVMLPAMPCLLSLLTVNSFHAAAMFFHRICISQCFNVNASWYRLHSNTFKLMTSSVLCDSTECQSEIQDKCITYMYYECFSLTWGNSSLCCIFLWTSVHFLWQHKFIWHNIYKISSNFH